MSDWSEVATLLERAVTGVDQVLENTGSAPRLDLPELPTTLPTAAELRRLAQQLARTRRVRDALVARIDEVRSELRECRDIRRAADDYGLSNRR